MTFRIVVPALLAAALLSAQAAAPVHAQAGSMPEAFTAVAIDLADGPARSNVDIRINRWSSESEKTRFARLLLDRGPEALLAELRDTPSVGTIRSPGSLPWDLRFAWQERTPDGGRRVLILTDRPIDWWEIVLGSPSLEYPFSLIELRLSVDGDGDGTLSVAARITVDRSLDLIELENYEGEPIRLTDVRSQHAT
jgi:hypothetical protein